MSDDGTREIEEEGSREIEGEGIGDESKGPVGARLDGDRAQGPSNSGPRSISRRDLLRTAGGAGVAALLPGKMAASEPRERADGEPSEGGSGSGSGAGGGAQAPQTPPSTRMVTLSVRESDLLAAMVDRLIPSDEVGPGALEAGALRFIDDILSHDLEEREDMRTGLAGLDRYSRYSRGAGFLDLEPRVQDSVLLDLQTGGATGAGAGFGGSSGSFFNMVKGHVWDAMFGDPHYGGNAGFAGWDLVRYPGVRQGVSPEAQRQLEEGTLEPMRRSAYDFPQFS